MDNGDRKQAFLATLLSWLEEVHLFIDFLDRDHPGRFIANSDRLRRTLETALDRFHILLRDDRLADAIMGFDRLLDLMEDFFQQVARHLRSER